MSIASFFGGMLRNAATSIDPIHPRDPALAKMLGYGQSTHAGVSVTHDTVLALPAILRGVSIISNGMAKLPFYVFKENDDGHEWDRSHVSWTAVTRKPHPEVTDGLFRQSLTAWAMLWGNGYAYIDAPNWPRGPIRMIPMLPDRTRPFRQSASGAVSLDSGEEGMLKYVTHVAGRPHIMDASQVLHVRGLGPNPYEGYSIFELLRQTYGGAIAAAEFGQRFYGKGANPAGFIETEKGFKGDEEAEERFIKSLRSAMQGLGRAHQAVLLEEGMTFKPLSINPDEAQFIEGKQFDVRQLAMTIGVKVHKLIDAANSSYRSLEQANQEHIQDDLMPWVCRWREEMEDKMLLEREKESVSHTIDIDDEVIQWVPFKDRAAGVVELYNNGLVDKDEGRRRVNFGPSKTARAKDYKSPANIVFEDDMATIEPAGDSRVAEIGGAYLSKIAVRLQKVADGRAAQGGKVFWSWLDGLETEDGPDALQPSIVGLYAAVHDLCLECTSTAKTDTELLSQVESATATFTAIARDITERDLTCTT